MFEDTGVKEEKSFEGSNRFHSEGNAALYVPSVVFCNNQIFTSFCNVNTLLNFSVRPAGSKVSAYVNNVENFIYLKEEPIEVSESIYVNVFQ